MDLTLKEFEDVPAEQLKNALRHEAREITDVIPKKLPPKINNQNGAISLKKQTDGLLKRLFVSIQNMTLRPVIVLKSLIQRI